MLTITQTRTSTPTTETRTFAVGSFWKDNLTGTLYAIIAPDCIMQIMPLTKCISVLTSLNSYLRLDAEIQSDEFTAEYEAAELAIVDAFQSIFPQSVNLEMSER